VADLLSSAKHAWSPKGAQPAGFAVELDPGQRRMSDGEYLDRLVYRLQALLEREAEQGQEALEAAYDRVENLLESRDLLGGRPRRSDPPQFAADVLKYNLELRAHVRSVHLTELEGEEWSVRPGLEAVQAYRDTDLETFVSFLSAEPRDVFELPERGAAPAGRAPVAQEILSATPEDIDALVDEALAGGEPTPKKEHPVRRTEAPQEPGARPGAGERGAQRPRESRGQLMSGSQRIVLLGVAFGALAALLFPPYSVSAGGVTRSFGYHFILAPPQPYMRIDVAVLAVELFALVIAGAALWLALHRRG